MNWNGHDSYSVEVTWEAQSGYRLIRSEAVEPEAIRDGGFENEAKPAKTQSLLLAVEDSTSISYTHAVATELGITSSNQDAKRNGFLAHRYYC